MPRTPRSLLLVALLAGGLAGCGGAPSVMRVSSAATADLNPGPRGAAFPAQVRLYQLRAPEKFSNADYFQLADHETTVLGNDLLAREEVTMHPGETRTVDLQTRPETRFVGVAVAFRNLDASTWRAVTPARARLKLSLGTDTVALGPQ